MANLTKLSKFISVILRHNPQEFGVELDEEGFTTLGSVWDAIREKYGKLYSERDLARLLETDAEGSQRFEVERGRIRARYGHSAVEVDYQPAVPPEVLYHGTNTNALPLIRKEGLKAMKRQFVHLSTDKERAEEVAGRRGEVVLLTIRAQKAHEAGHVFHHPQPKHYLVREIPPDFIDFDDEA